MKTQRRIIRCLLFTCAGNEYGLTDASLKTAKEITVASSLTIVSKPQRKQRMKRRGGGGKKRKRKRKRKRTQSVGWKTIFFRLARKLFCRHYSSCIEGKSRFSRSFVRCVRATIYEGYIRVRLRKRVRCTIQTRDDNSSGDNNETKKERKLLYYKIADLLFQNWKKNFWKLIKIVDISKKLWEWLQSNLHTIEIIIIIV